MEEFLEFVIESVLTSEDIKHDVPYTFVISTEDEILEVFSGNRVCDHKGCIESILIEWVQEMHSFEDWLYDNQEITVNKVGDTVLAGIHLTS